MPRGSADARWVRNTDLARYLSITPMTVDRWQKDPVLGFPQPARVRGYPLTDLDQVDEWMRSRVVARFKAKPSNAMEDA